MEINENADKIRTLYNELQKSLVPDSKEFCYINKYIVFKLYKAHINIFSMNIKFNSIEKLSILVFRSLVEDNDNERFINLDVGLETEIRFIIDIIKKKVNLKAIYSKINFMSNKFGNVNLFNNFKKSLANIGIKYDFIYLLLRYINKKGFILNDILKIIEPALQERYPLSFIALDSSQNVKMSMNEFMTKFCEMCKLKRDEQFFEIIWDNKKNDFILNNKTLDEIEDIILGGKRENQKKKKSIKNILADKKSKSSISDNSDLKYNTKDNRLSENNAKSSKIFNKDNGDNSTHLNDNIKEQYKENNKILDNQKENLEGSKIIQIADADSSKLVNFDDKKSKSKDINDNEKDMFTDMKKMIELMQVKIDRNEIKFLEKLKEEKKNLANEFSTKLKEEKIKLEEEFSEKLKEEKIKLEEEFSEKFKEKEIEYTKQLKKRDNFEQKLSEQLVLTQQKVEDLNLNLKMIGLRTAYKSLIDLIIYVFHLEDKGNLITKIELIKKYMKGINNINGNKIMRLIEDINMLLNDANYDAHFIDFNLNLTNQIINSIAQYTYNNSHMEIIGIIQKFNVESEFKDLVKIRTNKFKISQEYFKKEENRIITKIKNNPSNKGVIKLYFN